MVIWDLSELELGLEVDPIIFTIWVFLWRMDNNNAGRCRWRHSTMTGQTCYNSWSKGRIVLGMLFPCYKELDHLGPCFVSDFFGVLGCSKFRLSLVNFYIHDLQVKLFLTCQIELSTFGNFQTAFGSSCNLNPLTLT